MTHALVGKKTVAHFTSKGIKNWDVSQLFYVSNRLDFYLFNGGKKARTFFCSSSILQGFQFSVVNRHNVTTVLA